MSVLATTIFNLFVDVYAKKGTKHRELTDYIPNWSGEEIEKQAQGAEEMKNFLLSFAKKHNEKLKKAQQTVTLRQAKTKVKPKEDG